MTATATVSTEARRAHSLAVEVAWFGHTSEAGIARCAERAGLDAGQAKAAIAAAVRTGLLREVPRIGGYVAGRMVNVAVFGAEFAAFVAGEEVAR